MSQMFGSALSLTPVGRQSGFTIVSTGTPLTRLHFYDGKFLRAADLDTFIARYRPTAEFTEFSTDYEFQSYIKNCFLHYERLKKLEGDLQLRKDDEEN